MIWDYELAERRKTHSILRSKYLYQKFIEKSYYLSLNSMEMTGLKRDHLDFKHGKLSFNSLETVRKASFPLEKSDKSEKSPAGSEHFLVNVPSSQMFITRNPTKVLILVFSYFIQKN